ncbi:replication initiation protein RepC [Ensifer sp. MJa1]|uniref:replication initiation protein RepC n=1 Tax=Ensifer sp. MJa1 TaxID=2919888 RepID=UPI003FA52B1A
MLGLSPSAYEDALRNSGGGECRRREACILERAGHINSAGGYLRVLKREAERREFSLEPMVMSLMRANGCRGAAS